MTELPSQVEVEQARLAGHGVVRRTPLIPFLLPNGQRLLLKVESLQTSGSFKIRGAANRVRLAAAARCDSVVTASAGNHGLALTVAARARGLHATVFMAHRSSMEKRRAIERNGGTVRIAGTDFESALAAAETTAGPRCQLVHAFDDRAVVAGQATIGLELAEDLAEIATVIVPLGGGGLVSGIGSSLRRSHPRVRVLAVQVERYAAFKGEAPGGPTLADGIAIKRPGLLTRPWVEAVVDDVVTVTEDEVAWAMAVLAREAKLVAEGAGAAGVAAVLSSAVSLPGSGPHVALVSGGNVGPEVMADVMSRFQHGSSTAIAAGALG
jgi:threonine dehydratase